jgi:hypothetical protein
VYFAKASSARPHAQPAPLLPCDAPNSRGWQGQFLTRGVVDQAAEWIVLLDGHESHPIFSLAARDAELPALINLTRDRLSVRFRKQESPLHKPS